MRQISKFARLPLLDSFFGSLLGVGFDSRRERSLNKTLIISTLLLQIGSGYTTWAGLNEYVPWLVALVITFAIQGLLFASSWRLGAALRGRNFKISILVIFVVTMCISVFFSYSALLDRVYTTSQRRSDQLRRAKSDTSILITDLNQRLDAQLAATGSSCRSLLNQWHDKVNVASNAALASERSLRLTYQTEHQRLVARSQKEEQIGGTLVTINGQKYLSPKGKGPIAKGYGLQATDFFYERLSPVSNSLEQKETALSLFNSSFQRVTASNSALTPENVGVLATAWTSLNSLLASLLPPMPTTLREQTFAFSELLAARQSQDLNSIVLSAQTIDELRARVYAYLARLTFLEPAYRQSLFAKMEALGRYEGASVHQFVLAVGELERFNPLALGSLAVAVAIDILVLFCGLLGARPDSYLDMKNPDDLLEIQETAVELVLSLDLESLHSVDPFVRRAIEILDRSKPDIEGAYRGLPATLSAQDIEDLNLGKELGVLFALGLARHLPDGRVGLRTRLILWLADQVLRDSEARTTGNELRESFAQLEV